MTSSIQDNSLDGPLNFDPLADDVQDLEKVDEIDQINTIWFDFLARNIGLPTKLPSIHL